MTAAPMDATAAHRRPNPLSRRLTSLVVTASTVTEQFDRHEQHGITVEFQIRNVPRPGIGPAEAHSVLPDNGQAWMGQ